MKRRLDGPVQRRTSARQEGMVADVATRTEAAARLEGDMRVRVTSGAFLYSSQALRKRAVCSVSFRDDRARARRHRLSTLAATCSRQAVGRPDKNVGSDGAVIADALVHGDVANTVVVGRERGVDHQRERAG